MVKIVLSHDERTEIKDLRDAGVFQEINTALLENMRSGTIFIPCADGHHFGDLFTYHTQICGHKDEQLHHPLSLNGGALLIPNESPLLRREDGSRRHDDAVLLENLVGAIQLKQPKAVILYAHAPCGMARLHRLSIHNECALLFTAKDRIRNATKDLDVPDLRVWFHVYDSDKTVPYATYHLNRGSWSAYPQTARNLLSAA